MQRSSASAAAEYREHCLAPSTRKAYDVGLTRFTAYCQQAGFSPLSAGPPSEHQLECFVSHCASAGVGYQGIKLYVCAVRHKCIELGYGNVFLDKPRLDITLKGIKRVHCYPKCVRRPITTDVMYRMTAVLAAGLHGYYTDILCSAVMSLAFFAGLRCSEFCVTSKFDPYVNLCKEDISFFYDSHLQKHYLSLTLRSSKTDPFREGVSLLVYATGHLLCAVSSMNSYFNLFHTYEPSSPLFVTVEGQPLTRQYFVKLLLSTLNKSGFDESQFQAHSFR